MGYFDRIQKQKDGTNIPNEHSDLNQTKNELKFQKELLAIKSRYRKETHEILAALREAKKINIQLKNHIKKKKIDSSSDNTKEKYQMLSKQFIQRYKQSCNVIDDWIEERLQNIQLATEKILNYNEQELAYFMPIDSIYGSYDLEPNREKMAKTMRRYVMYWEQDIHEYDLSFLLKKDLLTLEIK